MPAGLLSRFRLAVAAAGVLAAAVPPAAATDIAPGGPIVLSEISYNPPARAGDDALLEFVEIHNRGAAPVDVSGWRLKDRDDEHGFVLPAGTVVPPGGYLAVARNAAALRAAYGDGVEAVGDVAFPLANDGDTVRLLDAAGRLADRVEYGDEPPWPIEADGEYATLERISLADDHTGFANFAASEPAALPGTPGAPNSRAGSISARHAIVLNEIMYNPVKDPDGDPLRHCPGEEFVELFNRGPAAADLSGWQFTRGIQFTFPVGTTLGPGDFLVVYHDEAAFRAKYPDFTGAAAGPYAGELDDGGEALLLADAEGLPADFCDHDDTPPWPVNPDGLRGSLELADPALDNDRARAWRESATYLGTPGARNSAAAEYEAAGANAGPQITGVEARPASEPLRLAVRSTDAVRVTARIADRDGVSSARVEYQAMPAGGYIRRTDARFETEWTAVEMALDPERGVHAAVLPAFAHRTLVRYRIAARDAAGAPRGPLESRFPFTADPEPNLAYFVYDGVPDYVANERSAFGPAGFVHGGLDRAPVYHLVAAAEDIESLLYERLPAADRDYRWFITFVHADGVHDHCRIRLRGGDFNGRYSYPKRAFKVRFNKGNQFRGRWNDGTPYANRRSRLNFLEGHALRGDGGAIEALAWKMYRDAGVLTAGTTFVQLRLVRAPEEAGQFTGDFFGLYLEVQDIDTAALQDQGRPVDELSSIYKFEGTAVKKHPDCDPSTEDIRLFQVGVAQARERGFFEENLDVPRYLSFRAVTELADNHDMDSMKNYYYYFNTDSARWEVAPWDLDHALGGDASGDENLRARVLPLFPVEYRNRFRFLWQVHCDAGRLNSIIDGMSDLVRGLADADQDRWDTEPREACPSWPNLGGACRTYRRFDDRMRELKLWFRGRAIAVQTMFRDPEVPLTPRNAFPYPGAVPSPPVRLRSSPFADREGDAHAATRWMFIEAGGDWAFPLWEATSSTELLEVEVPLEKIVTGREYRFRLAHMDATGRWSFVSEPTAFRVGIIDRSPPSVPERPAAVHAGWRSVALRWTPSRDDESGVMGYVVQRDGERLGGAPVAGARYLDEAPAAGETHEYRVVAVNFAGLESAPSEPLRVDVPRGGLGGWGLPAGGWDYVYEARPGEIAYVDARFNPGPEYLDGTWLRSSANDWDGSAPGPGAGAPGGAAIDIIPALGEDGGDASVLSLEDPGDPSAAILPPNNRRLLFLHAAGAADPFEEGITLVARLRVHPAPLDLPAPKAQAPDETGGRGQLGVGFRTSASRGRFALWLDGRGLVASSGEIVPIAAAELREFQTFWVSIAREGDGRRLRIYRNGAAEPVVDAPFDPSGTGTEASVEGAYLEMGLPATADSGAIQIDYFGYKAGAHRPAPEGAESAFVRGDADGDGGLSTADALLVLRYLFLAQGSAECLDAADANDSGALGLADGIVILARLFGHGGPPPPPYPDCGGDPSPDALAPCRRAPCAGGAE